MKKTKKNSPRGRTTPDASFRPVIIVVAFFSSHSSYIDFGVVVRVLTCHWIGGLVVVV